MNTLDQLIGRIAHKEFRLYKFSREFRATIITFKFLKLATMILSIWAGYAIVYQKLYEWTGNQFFAQGISLIILAAVEWGVYNNLNTLFKFLLRTNFKNILFPVVNTLVLFTFSFIVTINGIALRKYESTDATQQIVENSKLEKQKVQNQFANEIERIQDEIKRIEENPAGYMKNRRSPTRLTAKQLTQIQEYNKELFELRQERSNALDEVKNEKQASINQTQSKAKNASMEYKQYGIWIMIAQVVTGFLITYSYSQTYKEDNKLKVANEKMSDLQNDLLADWMKAFISELVGASNDMKKMLVQRTEKDDDNRAAATANSFNIFGKLANEFDDLKEEKPKKKEPKIGFKTPSKNKSNTRSNARSNARSNTVQRPSDKPIEKKLLGKLKKNDMLRAALQKQAEERARLHANQQPQWTESRIQREARVKRWKVYEYKNLMISAGLIPESDKTQ